MSNFNNDVTYHDKWDTMENNAALKKLDNKFFDRSYASPHCPVSWAPEVLALLERLDKELGIERNTSTLRAYYPQGNWKEWFITGPVKGFFKSIKRNVFTPQPSWSKTPRTIKSATLNIVEDTLHSIGYGFRCIKILKINPIINKILKPKLHLSQVKEKYGELVIYFSCAPYYEEYVDELIRETELKLAVKGAYHPVESFWDAGGSRHVDNEYNPDTFEVTYGTTSTGEKYTSVSETKYRNTMKNMGLDLKDIREKAELRKAKADPI